ncbi:MAG: hypothetical protein IJ837_03525 [Clostridia bacterium]|nr:hypothetical protein [Clostridia bacterium]
MIELNLETKNKEQEIIKDYLQKNASENLANKINLGVKTTKNKKELVNKKNLTGFFQYANNEAKKLAEKGASYACIEDSTVFGWAIHYFEEDSIIGTLYNLDGSIYEEEKPKPKVAPKIEPKVEVKKQTPQQTLFDFMDLDKPKINEELKQAEEKIPDYYKLYAKTQDENSDKITLIKLGDFYEAYDNNAEKISSILNLVLTSKDFGFVEPVKLAGFPIHLKDKYFETLQKQSTLLVLEDNNETIYEKRKTELENTKIDILQKLLDNNLKIL